MNKLLGCVLLNELDRKEQAYCRDLIHVYAGLKSAVSHCSNESGCLELEPEVVFNAALNSLSSDLKSQFKKAAIKLETKKHMLGVRGAASLCEILNKDCGFFANNTAVDEIFLRELGIKVSEKQSYVVLRNSGSDFELSSALTWTEKYLKTILHHWIEKVSQVLLMIGLDTDELENLLSFNFIRLSEFPSADIINQLRRSYSEFSDLSAEALLPLYFSNSPIFLVEDQKNSEQWNEAVGIKQHYSFRLIFPFIGEVAKSSSLIFAEKGQKLRSFHYTNFSFGRFFKFAVEADSIMSGGRAAQMVC